MEIMFSIQKKGQAIMRGSHNNVEKNEDNASFSPFYEEDVDESPSDSMNSSSSSDIMEDASSSSSSFEMSSLISQLPFKRGLSKHFEGKSQSFTSLSSVKSLEDLIKPEKSSTRKKQLKESKNFVWNFDKSKVIKKKSSKGTLSSLSSIRNQDSSLERNQGASLGKSSCLLQGIWRPLVEN